MKAERPLLGALGSFLAFLVSFFATGAALFFSGFGLSTLGLAAALVAFFFVSCAFTHGSHNSKAGGAVLARPHFPCMQARAGCGWPLALKFSCPCNCCNTELHDCSGQMAHPGLCAKVDSAPKNILEPFLSVC